MCRNVMRPMQLSEEGDPQCKKTPSKVAIPLRSPHKSGVQGTESLAGARGTLSGRQVILASSFFLKAGLRPARRIMSGCQNIRKSIPDWENCPVRCVMIVHL